MFEQENETKSKVDYEIDYLVKEIASEMSEYQFKLKILEISKNKTIVIRFNIAPYTFRL